MVISALAIGTGKDPNIGGYFFSLFPLFEVFTKFYSLRKLNTKHFHIFLILSIDI